MNVAIEAADLTNRSELERIEALIANDAHIGVLVNNAGMGSVLSPAETGSFLDMTDDQWNLVLDVTLNGTFRCMRAELQYFYENGGGVIVNTASVMAFDTDYGLAAYCASKAGVGGLTRTLALELTKQAGEG
mgnify:CR=1 FL=1